MVIFVMGLKMALKSLRNISKSDLTIADKVRFMDKVSVPFKKNECWEWNAFKNKKGYGQIMYRDLGNVAAHRFSYLLFVGDFEQKKIICHKCDNPSCVNPNHLFVGTHGDNMRDKIKKGRAKNPPLNLGVKHHLSKVNPDIVKEIRYLFSQGATQTSLATKFSLHISSMHNICRNKTWKNVK